MNELRTQTWPFVDWHGVWPGHVNIDGRRVTQAEALELTAKLQAAGDAGSIRGVRPAVRGRAGCGGELEGGLRPGGAGREADSPALPHGAGEPLRCHAVVQSH
jgi:hypothetical protein